MLWKPVGSSRRTAASRPLEYNGNNGDPSHARRRGRSMGPVPGLRRIPLGYSGFLVLSLSLYWLFQRLDVRGAVSGLRHGGIVGLVVWGALSLGLYSISTAALPLLVGWWIGQASELALAGAVLGAAANGVALKRIWVVVALAVIGCIVATIVLQTLGWAPAMRMVE